MPTVLLAILGCSATPVGHEASRKNEATTVVVPLVDEEDYHLLSEHNAAIEAAGFEPIPDTFVYTETTAYGDSDLVWSAAEEALAGAGISVGILRYADLDSYLSATKAGESFPLCYTGNPQVAAEQLINNMTDDILGDMFQMIQWRTPDAKGWGLGAEGLEDSYLNEWDEEFDRIQLKQGDLLIASFNSESDYTSTDVIRVCGESAPFTGLSGDSIEAGMLQVTEIMANPEGSDATGEWFELTNTTDTDIDLFGIEVADDSSTRGRFTSSVIVPAGAAVVVAREGIEADFEVAATYGERPYLNNDGDSIALMVGDTVVDEVSWEQTIEGHSLMRSSSDPAIWCDGAEPTPGVSTSQCEQTE